MMIGFRRPAIFEAFCDRRNYMSRQVARLWSGRADNRGSNNSVVPSARVRKNIIIAQGCPIARALTPATGLCPQGHSNEKRNSKQCPRPLVHLITPVETMPHGTSHLIDILAQARFSKLDLAR